MEQSQEVEQCLLEKYVCEPRIEYVFLVGCLALLLEQLAPAHDQTHPSR